MAFGSEVNIVQNRCRPTLVRRHAAAFADAAVDGEMAVSTPTAAAGKTLRMAESGSSVLTVGSLNLQPPDAAGDNGGVLDLNNDSLIARQTPASQIFSLLQAGYDGGAWDGGPAGGGSPAAILSSAAAADPYAIHALGYEQVGTGAGTWSPAVPFAGTTVNAGDTVVMYTYDGDAYLDGTIDGTDFTRIDNGLNNGLTGWGNGDFTYGGLVTAVDERLAQIAPYFIDLVDGGVVEPTILPALKIVQEHGGSTAQEAPDLDNGVGAKHVEIVDILYDNGDSAKPVTHVAPGGTTINVNAKAGVNGAIDESTNPPTFLLNVSGKLDPGMYIVFLRRI